MKPAVRGTITLPDDRVLGYGSYGDPQGRPLLLLDGPGSRVVAEFAAAPALSAGVHVVAPDRPGAGASTPRPGRTIRDWVEDAEALADELGWEQFAVLGVSGGCPYACATAWGLPERVTRLGILAGIAPLDLPGAREGFSLTTRTGFFFARRAPWLLRRAFRRMGVRAQRDPEAVAERLMDTRPEDEHVMHGPGRQLVIDGMPVMWRGADANAHEFVLMTRPWDFDLAEIRVPTWLWYGEADTVHPPGMGRAMAEVIPDSRLTVVPEVGSFAFITHLEPILRALTQPGVEPGSEPSAG